MGSNKLLDIGLLNYQTPLNSVIFDNLVLIILYSLILPLMSFSVFLCMWMILSLLVMTLLLF